MQDILDALRQAAAALRAARRVRPNGLERFLVEQPGVIERARSRRPCCEFEFDGGDDEQVQLVSRLIAAGFPVLEFSAHSAGLEDLFIEITEGRVQ